jgi:hypothetical protein
MKKAVLIVKGNYTQRQFDFMARLFEDSQESPVRGVALVQLSTKGNIGLIKIDDYGDVTIESMFNEQDE